MRSQRSIEIKVGIVGVAGLVLFILGITFGRGYHEALSSKTIKLRFNNSGGIEQTAPIVVNGVKRGSVLSVVSDNGSVLITATINKTDDIKSDASARITLLEITGGKKIEIFPGASDQSFDFRKEIPGNTPPDISELIAVFGTISEDAVGLFKKFDSLTSNINRILGNQNIAPRIDKILANTEEMAVNMNELLKRNISDLEYTLKNLKVLSEDLKIAVKDNTPKLDKLLEKLDLTGDKANNLIDRTDQAIQKADGILNDLKNISETIRSGDGLASRLIYDKELAVRLDSSLRNINSLVEQIRQHGINANISIGRRP